MILSNIHVMSGMTFDALTCLTESQVKPLVTQRALCVKTCALQL